MSWPVSDTFIEHVGQSHTAVIRIDLLDAGVAQAELTGTVSGSVTVERTAVQRRCQVDIANVDSSLSITEAIALLYGQEIRLWRGIDFLDGSDPELAPLGTFGISDVQIDWPNLSLNGLDRADRVSRARLYDPYTVPRNTNYATAIQALVEPRCAPGTEFDFITTSFTTPYILLEPETDPWEQAKQMAASCGLSLYFDQMGTCVLASEQDPAAGTPTFTYEVGEESVLLNATRSLSNRNTYNIVVAAGESSELVVPVRAVAVDSNPTSKTYYQGDYGQVVRFFSSSYIFSKDQATAAAQAVLKAEQGLTESLELELVPNPALDVGDVIRVIRPEVELDAVHAVDQITLSLRPGDSMQVATRSRPDDVEDGLGVIG